MNSFQRLQSYIQPPPIQPQPLDELIEQVKEEELLCDPMYLVIKIATIPLVHQQINVDPQVYNIKGIRLSIQNAVVEVQKPGYLQGMRRLWKGDTREQLLSIRPHLIKALKWFPPEKNGNYQEIFACCQKGLEKLLDTYRSRKKHLVITDPSIKTDSHQVTPIKINTTEKENWVSRQLEEDIALIDYELHKTQKRPSDNLLLEDEKRFPSQKLILKSPSQTIEEFLKVKIQKNWDSETITAIANIFRSNNTNSFNPNKAINDYIEKNPLFFLEIKNKLHEEYSSLSNYSIQPRHHND